MLARANPLLLSSNTGGQQRKIFHNEIKLKKHALIADQNHLMYFIRYTRFQYTPIP
jgi:hypothetical protein